MCYIEQRFETLVTQKMGGETLKTKWKSDKNVYTSYTAITAFDFQHFSMHDKSHSVRILQNIELLLGRQRVDMLGVGDLWLLLQAAYFHDIGMSLTSKDMDKLWESDSAFRAFLKERLQEGRYRDNAELYDAIDYYEKVDRVLNQKADFEAVWKSDITLSSSNWPIRLVQNIQYIIAEYVRRKHAERSRNYFERIFEEDKSYAEGVIEERLYMLVGTISSLHTEDFDQIFYQIPYEEVAMGDEHIHPRFAAAMLRIGDLLDMDNNRFNVRILGHRGVLPPKSLAHLRKHKALRHFEVNETIICASSYSDDFEACLETRRWYNWIDEDVGNLVKNWNRLVPRELMGCLLKKCDLKVYLKGTLFTTQDFNHFNFDSRKMHKLLIGDNIYDCRLDCLREYLQNAIDATKVSLWNKLKKNDINSPIKGSIPLHDLLPCDLREDAFLGFPIEIVFSYEKSKTSLIDDKICIEIRDRGIGMDKACVDGITTIGKGWHTREEYQDVFASAPKWLQPTGGFGIGVQSAFMLTDEVEYETRSEKEGTGHRIRLMSPESSGNVTREDINYGNSHGTTVTFRVNAIKFMNYEELGVDKKAVDPGSSIIDSDMLLNMFNQKKILNHTIALCKEYILDQIPNSIFPIYIGEKGTKLDRIASPYLYERSTAGDVAGSELKMLEFKTRYKNDKHSGESYRYLYHIDITGDNGWNKSSRIVIWNTQYVDCVCLNFSNEQISTEGRSIPQGEIRQRLALAFKNISIPKEIRYRNCCQIFLDIMGERAERCLQVSRSKLKNDFEEQLDKRLDDYLYFGLNQLIPKYLEVKKKTHANSKKNTSLQIGGDDLSVGWDFVRMVFCCITYLSPAETDSWRPATQEIKKFGQEALNDTIWRIHIKQQASEESVGVTAESQSLKANEEESMDSEEKSEVVDQSISEAQQQIVNKESAVDIPSMLEYCVRKLLETDNLSPEFFFCTDASDFLTIPNEQCIQLEQNTDPIDKTKLYDALEVILKPEPQTEIPPQKEKNKAEKENAVSIVYSYLLQTQERIFSTVWGDAVFGSQTERWKNYRKVYIDGRRLETSENGKNVCFLAPITVYFRQKKEHKETTEGSKMVQPVEYNNEELFRKYPLAVSRVPFETTLPKGQWAIISPIYPALKDSLEKLRETRPTNEEIEVKKLLKENVNFLALVDWVYCFQVPSTGLKYRTKDNIAEIYLKWVLDEYYGSRRTSDK